jgi:hypothetical protein
MSELLDFLLALPHLFDLVKSVYLDLKLLLRKTYEWVGRSRENGNGRADRIEDTRG